jgi:YidC/Oxa1 family membrane protein insertase
MDKRTLLAVILSTVVISVGFMVQNKLFPPVPVEEQVTVQTDRREASDTEAADTASAQDQQDQRDQQEAARPTLPAEGIIPYGEDPSARTVSLSTEVFEAVFSTRGAQLVSMRLKEHLENDAPLELIWSSEENEGAFGIAFGGPDGSAHNVPYNVRTVDPFTVAFYRDFAVETSDGPVPFTLTKTFRFQPEEYLFEVFIRIDNSVNAYPALDRDGFAYTLTVGPQIGPKVEKIDGRYEYRRYFTYENGKQKNYRIRNGSAVVDARITWAAVLGKYFAVVGVPDSTDYTVTFTEGAEAGLSTTSKLHFSRPPIRSSVNEDLFRFYMGPKQSRVLTSYNSSDRNAFGTSNLHLEEVMDQGRFLGWLEVILKRVLEFFYTIIPNWGVAIILLTIFVKLLLFPITHKSYESTSKMQTLQPKMTEIREKYKDNPTKMNQEMAELYKREKVNPMGGCLPLLLQMPIFIALYGLFNKYFDLRGAAFIPGWISDLSSPETIWNFAPVQLPLLGWSDLRLLPILFVATMVLSSKLMQNPGTGAQNSQMKMMTYMMPIVFFFILYDAPSGLLVYWIVTNFLTIVQQKIIGLVQKKKG